MVDTPCKAPPVALIGISLGGPPAEFVKRSAHAGVSDSWDEK